MRADEFGGVGVYLREAFEIAFGVAAWDARCVRC
jgi:hypothetical protein